MANEFVARKGLIVPGTGSIYVISGSVTASNFVGTASLATSSSFATTASYAMNAGSGGGFPFSGSAVITGSLNVTQAVTASYFKGDGSQLTNIPVGSVRIDNHVYDADGVAVVYILSQSNYTASDVIVSVGGIVYTPTIDYLVLGSSLTFTETPPSGSTISVRAFIPVASGSVNTLTGSFSGSFFGTSSWATNAVTASNVLKTKAGSVTNTLFGGTPLTASVTFSTSFTNTNYAVAITGEDSRAWTIQNKTTSGFVINSVSNIALTGTTYWTCTAYGEN